MVEVVLDRPFGPSCGHDDVGTTRGQGLLDAIGDDGPIHQRQHLPTEYLGIKPSEKAKIDCGRKHFKALGDNIHFDVSDSYKNFKEDVVG